MARLPDYIPPYVPPRNSLSRPSAARINESSPTMQSINWELAGFNQPIPVIYGRDRTAGLWLTRPVVNGSGSLVFAILWSWGEIAEVEAIYINGAPVPSAVGVKTYMGTQTQGVDATLAAALPAFSDTYPGLAYTVFEVPPGTITGFPQQRQISAVIRGMRIVPLPPPEQHRYWRIYTTEKNDVAAYTAIAEIELRATEGGPDQTGSGTPSSSSQLDGARTPAMAFDNNTATFWASTSIDANPWIAYDFGTDTTVQEVAITAANSALQAGRAPRSFLIQYSDTGLTWTTYWVANDQTGWGVSEQREYLAPEMGYSENPAECMADFISSFEHGLGKNLPFGMEECIDYCNEFVDGERRAIIGITLKEAQQAAAILDMFAAYAECLWSYQGGTVLMVPDAAVDSPVETISRDEIVAGTFRINGKTMGESPSSVSVSHRVPTNDATPWGESSQRTAIEAAYEAPSSVLMLGIHRSTEAKRKSFRRVLRLQAASSFAWQMFDRGAFYQRGDVVQLPDIRGLSSQLVRILSNDQIALGRYQLTAEPYSDSYYPEDPGFTTAVPVGGILPHFGPSVPAGWTPYSAADGYMLMGRSDTAPAGTPVGNNEFTVSGTTTSAGGHTGNSSDPVVGPWIRGTVVGSGVSPANFNAPEPPHVHDYESSVTSHVPQHRREILIQKTGSEGPVPPQSAVLADGPLVTTGMLASSAGVGRLLAAGTPGYAGDSKTRSISVALTPIVNHRHQSGVAQLSESPSFEQAFNQESAGAHDHGPSSAVVTVEVLRKKMAIYVASAETPIVFGSVIMFDPLLPLPTNWAEFDLENRCIEISTPEEAGDDVGDGTVSWDNATRPDDDHDHKGSSAGNVTARLGLHPNTVQKHTHGMSGSAPYTPESMPFRFIQYQGPV